MLLGLHIYSYRGEFTIPGDGLIRVIRIINRKRRIPLASTLDLAFPHSRSYAHVQLLSLAVPKKVSFVPQSDESQRRI